MRLNKNYWKKQSKMFNEYAARDDWKNKRVLRVEHTSLFPIHRVGRGPNVGEPTLLDFNTKLIEASAVYFHYERRFNSIEVYVNSRTDSASKCFFEVRKNGKNKDFVWEKHTPKEDLGWFIKELRAKYPDTYVGGSNDLKEILVKDGYSIVTQFDFTDQVRFRMPHHGSGSIHPEYIKALKNGIEIGWVSSGTYNSIPNVIRVTCSRGLQTKSLRDLKIESQGYYDGHYRCEILKSQANEAKRFFSQRFKTTKGA